LINWSARIGSKAIRQSYRLALPLARVVLPPAVRSRLAGTAKVIEKLSRQDLIAAFNNRAEPLSELTPLLPPEAFNGQFVLVNNALAWGGVERQIVYTLKGLSERKRKSAALLCLRLGVDADHDFYRPALDQFDGTVRNVVDTATATHILQQNLTPEQRKRIERCISWLPADTLDEIWRFIADFLVLRPAVVHAWQDALSISAGFAAHIAGVPRVIVAGRNVAPVHFGFHREHMKLAYGELASCPNLVMINNSVAGARSYADWLGLPASRFMVVRNGIDPTEIKRPANEAVAALRASLGIPAEALVVGSIFRLYPEKRPLLWLDVAARIAKARPDVHFVIFGSGPLHDEMLKRARNYGLESKLHLPSTIQPSALGLALFDAFLLTSEFEGTPNVVLEASLLGIPAVVTEAGGAAEAVDEGVTGFVAHTTDPSQIANRVLTCLDDPEFRQIAATSASQFILKRYGFERMIEETLALYRR
jgi:glycosyltransferase involved in cell wall biosynthesis